MMALLALGALAGEAVASGVTFRWEIREDALHGELSAETTGWIAVGFNDRAQLGGSRLLMTRVVDGTAHGEEHLAEPPAHPRREQRGGTSGLRAIEGREEEGLTTVRFVLALDPGDALGGVLSPGDSVHLTLAWSHSDDFGHHSAARSARTIEL